MAREERVIAVDAPVRQPHEDVADRLVGLEVDGYVCGVRQPHRDERMFVVAPGSVVLFFPKVRKLLADLRHMESSEREAARYYSIDGELLALVGDADAGFRLRRTGEFDLEGLQTALETLADDPAASIEPSVVAVQLASQRPKWRLGRNRF